MGQPTKQCGNCVNFNDKHYRCEWGIVNGVPDETLYPMSIATKLSKAAMQACRLMHPEIKADDCRQWIQK